MADRLRPLLAYLIVVVAFLGALAVSVQDSRRQDAVIGDIRARNQALVDQVEGLGQEPVVEPVPDVVDAPPPVAREGAAGSTGRPPTPEEIAGAVTLYCSGGRCVGPQGVEGEPGVAGETVVGPSGERGEDGESVVGPQGAPGETVVGPQGEQGVRGEQGVQGEPGEDAPSPPTTFRCTPDIESGGQTFTCIPASQP